MNSDWYWNVGGSATQVYSGARNIYVPLNDTDYAAFAQNNTATPTASEADLWPFMQSTGLSDWLFDGTTFVQPAVGEYTQVQLASYSASVRYNCEIQGVTSAGEPIRTDRVSRTAANQTVVYLNANPTLTVNWKTLSGFVVLAQADAVQHANDINAHVQTCFDTEKSVSDQITSGAITTLAQIDSAYQGLRAKAPPELKNKSKIGV
jgi:hypothetical protein